jgi:hypothetical protein
MLVPRTSCSRLICRSALPDSYSRHSVSGRRRRPIGAGLRPPLKPSVQFSRTGLSPKCALTRPTSQVLVNFAAGRWIDSVLQFPRTLPSGFFTKGTYPRQSLYSLVSLFAPTTLACRLPQLTALPLARSHRFHGASGTIRQSDYSPSLTPHFAPRL